MIIGSAILVLPVALFVKSLGMLTTTQYVLYGVFSGSMSLYAMFGDLSIKLKPEHKAKMPGEKFQAYCTLPAPDPFYSFLSFLSPAGLHEAMKFMVGVEVLLYCVGMLFYIPWCAYFDMTKTQRILFAGYYGFPALMFVGAKLQRPFLTGLSLLGLIGTLVAGFIHATIGLPESNKALGEPDAEEKRPSRFL
jgi:hypothetical protein